MLRFIGRCGGGGCFLLMVFVFIGMGSKVIS